MTTTQDKPALVYIHIFSNGQKYFGNAVKPNRPWDFKGNGRGLLWKAAFETHGEPVIQIRRNLMIEEADALEKWLFNRYVAQGGAKLQRRPSGKELAKAVSINKGKVFSDEHRTNLSIAHKGYTHSEATRAKMSASAKGNDNFAKANNRKVISMLDGRVTSAACAGRWNKTNPNYIGTWVDL